MWPKLAAFSAALLALGACDNATAPAAGPAAPAEAAAPAPAAAPAVPRTASVDLSAMTSAYWPEASLTVGADGAKLTTRPSPGGFSAVVPVSPAIQSSGPVSFAVKTTLETGALQIWASKAGDASTQLTKPVLATAENPVATVSLPNLDAPIWLVIANGSMDGPSTGVIASIEASY